MFRLPTSLTGLMPWLLTIFVGLVTPSYVLADNALSAKLVEQWIASQKALASWGDQNAEKLNQYEDQQAIAENPFDIDIDSMLQPLKASGLFDEAFEIVRKHGFDSMEKWAEANLLIAKTAAAIEIEKTPEMLNPDALQSMLDGANLPPEQKAMIEQAMSHNLAMLDQLKQVGAEQKEAVRPYLEKIMQLMEQ